MIYKDTKSIKRFYKSIKKRKFSITRIEIDYFYKDLFDNTDTGFFKKVHIIIEN